MPSLPVQHENERLRRKPRRAQKESGTNVVSPAHSNSPAAQVLPCPWCGAPVARIKRGGYVREFCSKAHKTDYNNALSKLSIVYARLLRTPGALKKWSVRGVNPWQDANSAPEAPERRK